MNKKNRKNEKREEDERKWLCQRRNDEKNFAMQKMKKKDTRIKN